jgi:superfamily II DNA or RNA helicase
MKQTIALAFNISEFTQNIYLPSTYLVRLDKDGKPSFVVQKANDTVLREHDLLQTPEQQRLWQLAESLSIKALEKKYNITSKKATPLLALLTDRTLRKAITQYIDRQFDALLGLLQAENALITKDIEQKVVVTMSQVQFATDVPPAPILSFQHTEQGILYRFVFENSDGTRWKISDKTLASITNTTAWILIDKHLYKIPNLNGNLVLPFRSKDEILVPQKIAKEYFQSFILKVVANLDIETEGFEVLQHQTLKNNTLELVQDFMYQSWGLSLSFGYERTEFAWYESRKQRNELDFGKNDVVFIHQTRRDTAKEAFFLEKLQQLGLVAQGNYWCLPLEKDATHPIETYLNWLQQQQQTLQDLGFSLRPIYLEQKPIALTNKELRIETRQFNDWFDVHGVVIIGAYSFPFASMMPYIQAENPFFPLPDGTFFLLPSEWMEKYATLAKFGTTTKEYVRLAKSQTAVLEEIELLENMPTDAWQETVYTPSPWLKAELRPYQTEGVKWLLHHHQNDFGACLADDMGLGKTLQTIAALLAAPKNSTPSLATTAASSLPLSLFQESEVQYGSLRVLIVVPASLVYNWEAEWKKFAPNLHVYKHIGAKRQHDIRILQRFDVVLTTYQTVQKDLELLQKIEWEHLVLDESHYIKNKESLTFKSILQLQAKHKLSLSGTPIENSLTDLWAQMQFINPGLLGSFAFFEREFVRPIEKENDEERKTQLRRLVAPFILRRTKTEVAKDLPELSTHVVYAEMTAEQAQLYEREKSAARNALLDNNFDPQSFEYRAQVMQTLMRLRQLVNHPRLVLADYEGESGKFNEVLQFWHTIQKSEHKALLFSTFTSYLELFKKQFEAKNQPFAHLTGAHTPAQRQAAITRFQTDASVQAFLISLKAGGTGLNLTAADYVFLLDPWWNPQAEAQAIARAHRIGQQKKVIALKFITKESIEEKILQLQANKAQLAADIIENSDAMQFSEADLRFLLA